MTSSTFTAGEWAAVAGLGARKLWQVQADGSITYREDESDKKSEITIGPDEAQRRIRPLVSKQMAEELRNTLAEAAPPNLTADAYARSKEYRRVLKSNDLRLMLETLRALYRHPNPGYPEEQNQDPLEDVAFSELAHALEVKPGVLKAFAKKAAGRTSLPDRSAESGVGTIELEARPGVWFAWFLDGEDLPDDAGDDAYPPSKLVVVHADAFPRMAELQAHLQPEPQELPIEGASMAAVDADAAKDKSFVRAIENAGHEIVQGRGAQVRLGGDGHAIAYVTREGGRAVLAVIELM